MDSTTTSSTHTEATHSSVVLGYTPPDAAHAAALWSGLALLTLLILAILVIRARGKHKVMLGDGGVDELTRMSRVFGNAIEYVPAGIAAMAVLALINASSWLVHLVGALLVFGRIAHAWGLSRSAGPSPGRAAGTMMTLAAFLIAGVALVGLGLVR